MEEVLAQPRKEASQYAPRMLRLKIPVDKIRDIIGKGGSVIKNLQETTSTRIDVEDNGIVTICGKNFRILRKREKQNRRADLRPGNGTNLRG